MKDLILERVYGKGDKGHKVRLLQEWLCLHAYGLLIDGRFGPATEFAVTQFQKKVGLKEDGRVGPATFKGLIRPMSTALTPLATRSQDLGHLVVRYAKRHLMQSPREVGGQNKGPWVRLYMDGHEGEPWPWCAGFACFVLKQACDTLKVELPIPVSFSCDSLAASARRRGFLKAEEDMEGKAEIRPGSFFLSRRTSTDWDHAGIVVKSVDEEVFLTIEGNTNDDGSREGYQVCRRVRAYEEKDFILF